MIRARKLLSVLLALVALSGAGYVGVAFAHGPQADQQPRPATDEPVDKQQWPSTDVPADAVSIAPAPDTGAVSDSLDSDVVATLPIDGHDVAPPLVAIGAYSRFDDTTDPLEHDTRASIYETVTESPGIYLAKVADETDAELSTVRYHCRVLTEEGLLERERIGGNRCLFPDDSRSKADEQTDQDLQAALRNDAKSEVLQTVYRHEPVSVSTLASELECTASTVSYHLDHLESRDLVERERDGRQVQIYLPTAVRGGVDAAVDG